MPGPYECLLRYEEPAAPGTYIYIAGSHGRATATTDTPASKEVPGGLQIVTFQVSLFDGIDPWAIAGGAVPTGKGGFGSIKIADPDGDLDYLLGKVMSGGTLTILRGAVGAAFSTFAAVATMTTAGLLYGNGVKELRLRDFGWFLEAPLHGNRYDGTGGSNGDASITGVIRPYGIGPCFNVTPQMVDATKRILQLTDGAMWAVSAMRNNGVAWGPGTNRASYAAMDAATPAASVFDTCLAEGYIRLGSGTLGDITVDFTGDCTVTAPYLKRGDIAKRIVTRAGTGLSTAQVDATALAALNTAQPDDTNFFWNGEITKRAALDEVMSGCCGWWYINPGGNLVLGALDEPTGTPLATYTWPDDFVGAPTALETFADPRYRTTLGYQRNYTVQARSTLAGSVSDADAALYSNPSGSQWASADNGLGQRTDWPTSTDVKRHGGFTAYSPAKDEATRQNLMFRGHPTDFRVKERYQALIVDDPYTMLGYLGGILAIAGFTDLGWSSPRQLRLVGVEFLSDTVTKATLWG